jgi:hypothetical protein
VGSNQDGSFYLLGLTQQTMKVLETPGFSHGKSAEALAERAKKAKFAVFATPETYAVTGEEALRKWLESREALSPLFHAAVPPVVPPAPAPQQEAKKHNKRHQKGLQPQFPPAGEKPQA